jgi:glycosyltransferase involved in cell wall biosynthesis
VYRVLRSLLYDLDMKILCVHNTPDLYGASRCMERVFGRFAQDGHEVHVALPGPGPVVDMLRKNGVHVHIHPGLSVFDRSQVGSLRKSIQFALLFPVAVLRLIWLVLRYRIDVIHTNTVVLPASGVAAFLTRTPHVWHIRELLSEFGKLWKPYQRYIGFVSTRIIAISLCVRDQFDPSIQKKVQVIYDGLDDSTASVNPEREAAFRSLFPDDKFLVGVVGRIKWHRKGQEILVKAASLLKDRFPRAHYVIVGSTPPGNEAHLVRLRDLVSDLGLEDRVTFAGETDDPMSVFAALDVAVVPSVQAEPFGGVVLEAMSAGTPVVGSRCGGIPDQIVDEVSGILFTPGDPDALADGIARLLDDPELRKRMSAQGILRVRNAFAFENTYNSMAALFEQVVGTR